MSVKTEEFLEHFGKKGMKWGKRNSRTSGEGSQKQSRGERRKVAKQERRASDQKKAVDLVKKSIKDPQVLIKLNGQTIITGKEFTKHMANGGMMNIRTTQVFAQINKKTQKYERV